MRSELIIAKTRAGEIVWTRLTHASYGAKVDGVDVMLSLARGRHTLSFARTPRPERRTEKPPSDLSELWAAIEARRAAAEPSDWLPPGRAAKLLTEPVIEPRLALDLAEGRPCEQARFGPYHLTLLEVAELAHTIRYSYRLVARPAADAPPVVVVSHEVGMKKGIWVVHVGRELGRTAGDAPIWVSHDTFRAHARQLMAEELLDSSR